MISSYFMFRRCCAYVGDKDDAVMKVFRRPQADSLACKALEGHGRHSIARDAASTERVSASERTAHRLDACKEQWRKRSKRPGGSRSA